MKANYHTHTHFCGHAKGNAIDYAKEAIKHNFKVLGISDHAPNDKVNDYYVRMKEARFEDYLHDIEQAQNQTKGLLTIYKGIEVEYFHLHEPYYDKLQEHLDYMIHGQHYITKGSNLKHLISSFALSTKEEINIYADFMILAIKSKRFLFHAHPDLYMCGYKTWDQNAEEVAHRILKVAKEHDAIFEYNANGYRRGVVQTDLGLQALYPRKEFWDLVSKYKIKTILSSDCHHPELLYDDTIREAEEDYKNLKTQDVGVIIL